MSPSFISIPPEVTTDRRLTLIETRILVALYSYHDMRDPGPVWPSRDSLAARSGYCKKSVSCGISGLVEKGWVTRHQRRGPNAYEIHIPDLGKCAEEQLPVEEQLQDKQLPVQGQLQGINSYQSGNRNSYQFGNRNSYQFGNETVTSSVTSQPPTHNYMNKPRIEKKEEEVRAREMLPNCDDPPKAIQKPPAQSRGTRLTLTDLPPDWAAWCREKFSHLDAGDVWEVFHDYWIAQPGQKGVKLDWLATWRNWCRRDADKRKATMSKQERIEAANKKLLSDRNARSHNGHNGHNTIDGEFHVINH